VVRKLGVKRIPEPTGSGWFLLFFSPRAAGLQALADARQYVPWQQSPQRSVVSLGLYGGERPGG